MASLILKLQNVDFFFFFFFFFVFSFLVSLSQAKNDFPFQFNERISFCNDTSIAFLPPQYRDLTGFKCSPPWGSTAFKFLQDGDDITTIVLSSESVSGWVGIGFSKDGKMVGSSAVVGWVGEDVKGSGIRKYLLQGKSMGTVVPDRGEMNFTDVPPFVTSHDGFFYMGFQVKFKAPLHRQFMILALGTGNPVDDLLPIHLDRTIMEVDFSPDFEANGEKFNKMRSHHGLMGLIGWGVLLPFGVIIARYFKAHEPHWLYLHGLFQLAGFVLGLLAIEAGKKLYLEMQSRHKIHKNIGYSAFYISILQVLALILRPDRNSKGRRYWVWYHQWLGRLALLLGAINIVIGIHIGQAKMVWKLGYGILSLIILITVIVLEAYWWLGRSKKGSLAPVLG